MMPRHKAPIHDQLPLFEGQPEPGQQSSEIPSPPENPVTPAHVAIKLTWAPPRTPDEIRRDTADNQGVDPRIVNNMVRDNDDVVNASTLEVRNVSVNSGQKLRTSSGKRAHAKRKPREQDGRTFAPPLSEMPSKRPPLSDETVAMMEAFRRKTALNKRQRWLAGSEAYRREHPDIFGF